jgi:hypothetical protein
MQKLNCPLLSSGLQTAFTSIFLWSYCTWITWYARLLALSYPISVDVYFGLLAVDTLHFQYLLCL